MLGQPLSGLGLGITLWKPPEDDGGGGPPVGDNRLLQESGTTDLVQQESDATFITLEAG